MKEREMHKYKIQKERQVDKMGTFVLLLLS